MGSLGADLGEKGMARVTGFFSELKKNPRILSLASRSPSFLGSDVLPHYPNLAWGFPQAWPQAWPQTPREEAP